MKLFVIFFCCLVIVNFDNSLVVRNIIINVLDSLLGLRDSSQIRFLFIVELLKFLRIYIMLGPLFLFSALIVNIFNGE